MKLKLTINHQEHIKKINKITLKNQRIRRSYFRVNVAQASSYRLPPWRRRKTASDEFRLPVLATARHLLLLLCCWMIEEEEGDEGTTAGDDDQVRREELVNRKLKQDRLCWVYRREELMKKGAAAITGRSEQEKWWSCSCGKKRQQLQHQEQTAATLGDEGRTKGYKQNWNRWWSARTAASTRETANTQQNWS